MLNRAKDWVINGWLIALLTLALVAVVEVASRVIVDHRDGDPRRSEFFAPGAWRALPLQYVPGSLWKLQPGSHSGARISDDGYRAASARGSAAGRPIWVFGGSSVFGLNARVGDAETLPAALERELARRHPGAQPRVVNFGVPGFDRENELALLVRRLGRGEKPEAVVFLDGAADVELRALEGVPHAFYGDFEKASVPGRALLLDRLRRASGFLRLLSGAPAPDAMSFAPEPELPRRVRETVDGLAGTYDWVERLARAQGFRFVAAWQPTLLETRKTLTADEKALLERVRSRAPEWLEAQQKTHEELRARIAEKKLANYIDLSGALDTKNGSAFAGIAELEPEAHAILASRLADLLGGR